MTRAEAEKTTDDIEAYVRRKMAEHNLGEVSETYLKRSHEITVYDELAGDFTRPYDRYHSPSTKLRFWSQKLKYYRVTDNGDLKTYIIEQINEARRGE